MRKLLNVKSGRVAQKGMGSILIVSGILGLIVFLSVSGSGSLSLRKEISEDTWDIARAQMNANEGVAQLQAYFNSLDHNRLSLITAAFPQVNPQFCNSVETGPAGHSQPLTFRLTLPADRVASGDGIEIYAAISHRENTCLPPDPVQWKVNYRIVGTHRCDVQGQGACARHELLGAMLPSENFSTTTCDSNTTEICTQKEVTVNSQSEEVSVKSCGQDDAYEFKPLNLRTVGGFLMGDVYSGAVAANPNRIRNLSKLWRAPVTVTGNIVNGSPSSRMFAEGFKTRLSVSFAENQLFIGAHNMPPLPYYKPLEVGGGVVPRAAIGGGYGSNGRDLELNVLGVTPAGENGTLGGPGGPLHLDYSYLPHPANPGRELRPDLLHETLLSQTANLRTTIQSNSVYLNTSHLSSLQQSADNLVKHYLGLNISDLKRVSRAGIDQDLNSLLPIEPAQRDAQRLFASGNTTADQEDWRKLGVVYYYVDVRSQPRHGIQYERNGQLVNASPVYSSGQGLVGNEFAQVPTIDFCETEVANGANPDAVDFRELVHQSRLAEGNRSAALYGGGQRDPTVGCEVALESQNPSAWRDILQAHDELVRRLNEAASMRAEEPENSSGYGGLSYGSQSSEEESARRLAERRREAELSAYAQWEDFLRNSQSREKYRQALTAENYRMIKTERAMVDRPRWQSYQQYISGATPRWIRDHWNNPLNTSSNSCLSWDSTAHRVACSAPYSGAQSTQDNAVVVIDARGTDGVYWRHLRYPAAQLIIVLGNLFVEDVMLNANVVVGGDLILMGRGLSVAPRRWWGIPRYKQCSARLPDNGAITTSSDRLSTDARMRGLFYFFTDRTDQVRSCIVRRSTGSVSTRLESVCTPVTQEFCSTETRTAMSRLEPSIRFFER